MAPPAAARIIAHVVVGRYELTVESSADAHARQRAEGAVAPVPVDLVAALRAVAAEVRRPVPGAMPPVDDALVAAEGTTAAAEAQLRAVRGQLAALEAISAGRLVEGAALRLEVDLLEGLVTRLDREGRYADVVRAVRDAVAVYLLLQRWIALVEGTRAALVSAQALGDRAGEAWALHELGTVAVVAGEDGLARTWLAQAVDLREGLGDAAGAASSARSLALARQGGRLGRHALEVAVLSLTLLAGGAVGFGVASAGDDAAPAAPSAAPATVADPETVTVPTTAVETVTRAETTTETATVTEPTTEVETATVTETATTTETVTETVTEVTTVIESVNVPGAASIDTTTPVP